VGQEARNRRAAVPASHGFAWLLQSLAILRRQPGRLLMIAILMQLILGLTQVPLLGLLVMLSVPGLNAGILQAFHAAAHGSRPPVSTLFLPLASSRHNGRMLGMGALVFAVGLVTMSVLLSGNQLIHDPDLLSRIEQGDVDAIAQLDLNALGNVIAALAIGIAVSGTLSYFTIPLVWFRNRKLWPAIGEGLRAMVVNWKPFLVLALGLAVLLVPVSVAAGLLFGLATAGGALSVVVMGLVMLVVLLFQMVLFGTQYCAFRDIFGVEESEAPAAGPPPGDDGQFVA
jgi:hypothetical protein